MDLALSINIESAHIKADGRTLSNDSGDFETLIHIIEKTGHYDTLFQIINSVEDGETLDDIVESAVDVGILRSMIEIIENNASKLLNGGRTFTQDELDTALISTCCCGYTFLVNDLIHLGANLQTRDKNGNTPLLICVENGFTNIAKCLIGGKININAENNLGNNALILAVSSLEMVKLLLADTRIYVNHQNKEGYTALMKAIEARNIDIIKLLLDSQEHTTDVLERIKNCRNETAQDIADKMGIGTTVRLLIQHYTKMHNPVLAAVLTCDMDSFNILMDCHVYEPSYKKRIIQDSFSTLFTKHKKSGENFSKKEEEIIQRLLQCGANVDDCPYSCSPLVVAARVGSGNVVEMFLKNKAYLHKVCSQRENNALAVSAKRGHAHIIELLLKNNRNLTKNVTTVALINAMANGHCDCKEMLTKYGASLDIKSAFESAVKNNASKRLRYLVENFRVEISRAFSAVSMNNFVVSASRSGYIDIIGILLDAGVNVNCVNTAEKTPLMAAKNVEVVNFLVQRGAVVSMNSTEDNWVYSPLPYVLSEYYYHSDSPEKVKIVEALLKHGAPVNENFRSGSPLIIAISNKASSNIVQFLLDHGADVSVRDRGGRTVLLIAAENESTENIKCLLHHNEVRNIINVQNPQGLTALMISTRTFNHLAVKALIDHGADVNIKDVAGNTALMLAVYWHRQALEILTTLIHADSDINCQNESDHSPLMLTALASWTEALILLVDSGAEVNAVSGNNETALSLTMKKFNPRPSCVKYLLDHGADASFVKPEFIIRLILRRKLVFVPKLMRHGLVPTEISSLYLLSAPVRTVSPLYMALMTGNVKLATYFVENLFVTKSDMFHLIHNKDVRQHLHKHKLHECLGFLDKQSAQPLSLFSLAFITVQSAIGAAPGREERVSRLSLPQMVKDMLMFKVEIRPLDMSANRAEMTAYGNIVDEIEASGGLFSDSDDYDYDCYAYTSYYKSASSDSDDSEDDSGDSSDVESHDSSEVYADGDYLEVYSDDDYLDL